MSENLFITSNVSSGVHTSSFWNASGSIDYSFTNDYMFNTVLQYNNHVLKGLICSLLHLQPDDIISVEVKNPILPGRTYDNKEFILDTEVTLNDNTLINLEMQVINEHNWPERSLSYLCRRFDQLLHGQDYIECKPAVHIGFLDFSPFSEFSEFYATYRLLNIKNQNLYSDKFSLSVIDLTHIELATDEDKIYGIDRWAKLLKSTTWEELKMIAKNNPILTDASETLFILNSDDAERRRSQARAEFIAHEKALNNLLARVTEENVALTAEKQALVAEKQTLSAEIERLRAQLAAQGVLEVTP